MYKLVIQTQDPFLGPVETTYLIANLNVIQDLAIDIVEHTNYKDVLLQDLLDNELSLEQLQLVIDLVANGRYQVDRANKLDQKLAINTFDPVTSYEELQELRALK